MAILKTAQKFHNFLLNSKYAKKYCDMRKFNEEAIKEFMVGYCPPHENHWASGRITIPIFDVHNRFLDFGTRKITKPGEKNVWMNGTFRYTPIGETHKKHHLYNLNKAKWHILGQKYAIVTEGYFDVITAWRCGIKNIVATCGTSFSYTHLCLLSRYCEYLVFAYDADEAGRSAAMRSSDTVGLNIGFDFLELPDGYDVDDYLKKFDVEQFNNLVNSSIR